MLFGHDYIGLGLRSKRARSRREKCA